MHHEYGRLTLATAGLLLVLVLLVFNTDIITNITTISCYRRPVYACMFVFTHVQLLQYEINLTRNLVHSGGKKTAALVK